MDKKNKKPNILDNKFFLIVISLLASILLWAYVTTSEGDVIERTYEGVQVVFKGQETLLEKDGLVISNVSSNTVSVRLRTTRREISKLSSSNMVAGVDVSKFNSIGNYNQSVAIEFPIGSDTSSIDIVSTLALSVSCNIDKTSTKTIEL